MGEESLGLRTWQGGLRVRDPGTGVADGMKKKDYRERGVGT